MLTLLLRLAEQPTTVGDVSVTPTVLRSLLYGTFAAADTLAFPDTAGVLQYLAGEPGAPAKSTVAQLLTQVTAVPPNGSATASAMLAITCGDRQWPRGTATYRRATAAEARAYPLTGGALANIRPCAYWPVPAQEKPTTITSGDRVDVLMLQNRRDPVTPYAGALRMRQALGDRARMISIDAAGHGAGGNPCALDAASAWLVNGTAPTADTNCPAGPGATS